MAALTMEQVLGYIYLTGVIERVKSGIPDVLPKQFTSITKNVMGNAARYTRVFGTRQTARHAMYGSTAVKRVLKGIESKDAKLLHTYEMIEMDPLLLQTIRNYDNYDMQKMGIDEVERQQAQFRYYFDNLRMSCIYSFLSNGHIWFNDNGDLLPTSSGNTIDVDYEIPANNQNQLNGIIDASWALFNTNIPLHLRNIKFQSRKDTGYELETAYYGINIPSYMTQNNYVLDYLARNPGLNQKYLDHGEIPNGLFGFNWVPVYSAFFEDQNGVNQSFFDGDKIIFAPKIDQQVYEMLQGSYQVPTSFNAVADLMAALRTLKTVYGMFSYAIPILNPPTAQMFYGDTFLPVWKIPAALYQADVTP